jgi:hypothetical protein
VPELARLPDGVCPVVVVILGRRGTGKTRFLAALAPDMAPPDKEVIVSPLGTLKALLPDVTWYKISAMRKEEIEKLFARFNGTHVFVLADEGDELSGAGPAGYAGGFVTPSVYDFVNYAREAGGGIAISSRRHTNVARDVTANANLVFIANTTDEATLKFFNGWLTEPFGDVDYVQVIRCLPDYVFVCWQPQTTPKFGGYVCVNDGVWYKPEHPRGKIRPWDPKELRNPEGLTPEPGDTDESTSSEPTNTGGTPGESGAPPAGGLWRTAPAPTTAPSATPKGSKSKGGSAKR